MTASKALSGVQLQTSFFLSVFTNVEVEPDNILNCHKEVTVGKTRVTCFIGRV